MDYAALFAAGVAGLVIGGGVVFASAKAALSFKQHRIRQLVDQSDELWRVIHSLRANCFLTNERGHRVRYADASVAVRARAEGGQ